MEDWPKCGGANGSIQFDPEITHAANSGLNSGLALLEPIHEKYKNIGFADLLQLASAQAVLVRPALPCALCHYAPGWLACNSVAHTQKRTDPLLHVLQRYGRP